MTSCKSAEIGSHIDDRDQGIIRKMDARRNSDAELRKIAGKIANLIGTRKHMMYFRESDLCEKTLSECRDLLETMRDYSDFLPRYHETKGKIDKFEKELDAIGMAAAMSQEERNHVLGVENPDHEEAVLQEKIHGVQLAENFYAVKESIEKEIEDGEYQKAQEMIAFFKKEECKTEKDSPFNGVKGEMMRRMNILVKRINVCVDRKRRLERKKLKQEEEKRDRKVSEESRRTMLEILQRMESAKAALENEETGKFDDDIEVIYFLLEQLPIKDENYMILKAHADLLAAEAGKPTRAVAA